MTKTTEIDIGARYLDGESVVQIAQAVGLHPTTVCKRLRTLQVRFRSAGRPIIDRSEWVRRYQAGERVADIARESYYTPQTIYAALARYGVVRSASEAATLAGRGASREARQDMVKRYEGGEPIHSISQSYGLSYTGVKYHLRQAGVELREAKADEVTTIQVTTDTGRKLKQVKRALESEQGRSLTMDEAIRMMISTTGSRSTTESVQSRS